MELIDQHTKKIMERCKERARVAGLQIRGETLEYILTNKDLLELSPRNMIPTLYNYWVHDVDVIREKWVYDVYPSNPYETVINTRPAISFYNDNNPDWMNVMIFYHVLAHIDCFQNNIFFERTWDDDFCGQALADKRHIERLRRELGEEKRWVDYAIEFALSVDNLVGYYPELREADETQKRFLDASSTKSGFYFGEFLEGLYEKKVINLKRFYEEIERYNSHIRRFGEKQGEVVFFDDPQFKSQHPEFSSIFEKRAKQQKTKPKDLLEYLVENSPFLNKEKNKWIKDILQIVRKTSLYFQPQLRTQILNEGWASYWHENLFLQDEALKSHESDYATINAKVLQILKVGLNPYAIGKLLLEFIEEMAGKGKLSYRFQQIKDVEKRKRFDEQRGEKYGKEFLFKIRENLNDFTLINFLSEDDFQDFVTKNNLLVAGLRLNAEKGVIEVYIKSKKGRDYRQMLNRALYHPPHIVIEEEEAQVGLLGLNHFFEGRSLVTKYIPAVLIGLEYLWGDIVELETTEFEISQEDQLAALLDPDVKPKYKELRVRYTCHRKDVTRRIVS